MKPYWVISVRTKGAFPANSRERARLFQCMKRHTAFKERYESKSDCEATIKCMEKDGVGGFGLIGDGQMIATEALDAPGGI